MPRKRLGHRIGIKLDGTAIGCLKTVTPAEKSRGEVDVTCLGDELMEYLDTDPADQGILKFVVVWEPGETNSQLIDTLFDAADSEDREGAFEIDWEMFDPMPTDAFSGRVLKCTPETVESKTAVARAVEVRLTTKITRTVAS
jgi:hypothetical protein